MADKSNLFSLAKAQKLSLILLLTITFGSCCFFNPKKCNGPCDDQPCPEETIEEIITSVGDLAAPEEYEQIDSIRYEEKRNGEIWICQETQVDVSQAPQEFVTFDPNAEVIVPGVLLEGASLIEPTPTRVPIRRGAGSLGISTINGSSSAQADITEVTVNNVYQAANEILADNSGIIPSRWTLNYEEVKTIEEYELKLKASANYLKVFKGSMSFTTTGTDEYNRVLISLHQSYYNLLFERPSTIESFFHESVTPDEVKYHTSQGNPLVYISSVNYGRKFFILVESTESTNSIKGAINASLSFLSGGGGGSVSGKKVSQLTNISIKTFAIGGDSKTLKRGVLGSVDELKNALAESDDIRSGVPISYVVRSVRSDQIVKNGINTKFTIKDCQPWASGFPPYISFIAQDMFTEVVEENGSLRLLKWQDLTGKDNHAEYVSDLPQAGTFLTVHPPIYKQNYIRDYDAVEFSHRPVAHIPGNRLLRFPAIPAFRNDYSLVFVLNWNPHGLGTEQSTLQMPFLSTKDTQGLEFGFKGRDKIYLSHNGTSIDAALPPSHLYKEGILTITFSTLHGISIYYNGALLKEETLFTTPVENMPSAILGFTDLVMGAERTLDLIEFSAFDKKLTDKEREHVEEQIRNRYLL